MNKKFYYLIALIFFATAQIFAQGSQIRPVKVVWVADGDTLTVEQAQSRGVKLPSKLQIVVILDPRTIGKYNGEKLEFKWYKRGPTRDYLTNSLQRQINTSAPGSKAYTVSAGRGNLRAGWWKVQIEAYRDRKLLSYRNKQIFWIEIK